MSSSKPKVLWLEDHDGIKIPMGNRLKQEGFQVDFVDNLVQARHHFEIEKYDFVISDLRVDAGGETDRTDDIDSPTSGITHSLPFLQEIGQSNPEVVKLLVTIADDPKVGGIKYVNKMEAFTDVPDYLKNEWDKKQSQEDTSKKNKSNRKIKLLYLEDDSSASEMLKTLLEMNLPVEVTTCTNLEDARKILDSDEPEIVIADVMVKEKRDSEKQRTSLGFLRSVGDESPETRKIIYSGTDDLEVEGAELILKSDSIKLQETLSQLINPKQQVSDGQGPINLMYMKAIVTHIGPDGLPEQINLKELMETVKDDPILLKKTLASLVVKRITLGNELIESGRKGLEMLDPDISETASAQGSILSRYDQRLIDYGNRLKKKPRKNG